MIKYRDLLNLWPVLYILYYTCHLSSNSKFFQGSILHFLTRRTQGPARLAIHGSFRKSTGLILWISQKSTGPLDLLISRLADPLGNLSENTGEPAIKSTPYSSETVGIFYFKSKCRANFECNAMGGTRQYSQKYSNISYKFNIWDEWITVQMCIL